MKKVGEDDSRMSRTRNRRSTVRAPYTLEESRPEKPQGSIEARESEGAGEIPPTSMGKPKKPQVPKLPAKRKGPKVYKSILATPILPPIPEAPAVHSISNYFIAGTKIRDWSQDITLELPLKCPICQLTFAYSQGLRQHIIVHVMVEGRKGVIERR